MFRNIVWDVDGTLFDTYPAISRAFKMALNDLGQDATLEQIEGLARKSLGHCVSTLADQCRLNAADISQGFEAHYDLIRPDEQPPFPGVIAICKYIQALGGKNVVVTHRERASTDELLAANEMTQYFVGYVTRDDGYPKKPHPAAFEAILKTHELLPEETLTVGDRDIDILAGHAAGLFTCLFGDATEGGVADLTIRSFEELYRYLLG
jgi:phosphoglycolate phosphatase-like HAD superfamily hydrolase